VGRYTCNANGGPDIKLRHDLLYASASFLRLVLAR
jgi:hypothetical protein